MTRTCQYEIRRIQQYMEGSLDEKELIRVEDHLEICSECRQLLETGAGLDDALRRGMEAAAREVEVPSDLESVVQDRLRRAAVVPDALIPRRWLGQLPSIPASIGLERFNSSNEDFLANFFRLLALMTSAGRPVVRSLESLAEATRSKARRELLTGLAGQVAAGRSLSQAMRETGEPFPPYLTEAVRAGECSGQLPEVLGRLAAILEKRDHYERKFTSTLTYPMTTFMVVHAVFVYVGFYIMPKWVEILKRHHGSMPMPSEILLRVYDAMAHTEILLPLALLPFILYFVLTRMPWFGGLWHELLLRIPGLRTLYGQYYLGWYSGLVSTLLAGGLPAPRAMQLAAGSCENTAFRQHLEEIQHSVEQGQPLRQVVARSPVIPEDARCLLTVGEETNALGETFSAVSELCQERLEAQLNVLNSMLEPLLIAVIGIIVALFVYTMYVPILPGSRLIGL